ncbi:MAG TPA: phospholipase D-like domain-containing protein [Gemmatimonadales bacterium]|nr:phospholipase D-like domain-containing protein [Gemmatimonadales bacterium]
MTGRAADSLSQSVASAINRAAGGRPIPGNHVELLIDGPETYAAMLDLIARASRWIHFENYIIRSDTEGWRFAEALAARAREGIPVRVLYDGIGSMFTSRKLWRFLRRAGAEVRPFHPLRPLSLVTNFARDHRKLVVADGAGAVLGGLCIGCEWTGDGDRIRPWRDTAVRIGGPASAVLDQSFARTWSVAGRVLPQEEAAGRVTPEGGGEVRVIMGEPGRERAFRVIELLAAGSVERLWITDAYMVAPPRLFQALRDAARDGVDVRMLVPGSSDLPVIRNLSRIGYRDLLRSGVRIYEWDGPMLHAKSVVADGRWVRIGSSNLNPSSLIGNYELDVLIEDPALADAMERQFRLDIGRSREVWRRPLRGPRRISKALPAALTRSDPEVAGTRYRRSPREARRRAVLVLRTIANNARRSVFLPLSAIFVALGILFFVLPRETAFVFGVICAWLAISAAREAFRRRADR